MGIFRVEIVGLGIVVLEVFRVESVSRTIHSENYISFYFKIERNMIVVTVFISILNQIDFHLVQNRTENCHHDHIPLNLKGNGKQVFSVYGNTV